MGPGGASLVDSISSSDVSDSFKVNRNKANQLLIPRSWRDTLSFVVITTILSRSNRVPPVVCVRWQGAGKDIYARLAAWNTLLLARGRWPSLTVTQRIPYLDIQDWSNPGLLRETVSAPRRRISISMGCEDALSETLETLFLGSFLGR